MKKSYTNINWLKSIALVFLTLLTNIADDAYASDGWWDNTSPLVSLVVVVDETSDFIPNCNLGPFRLNRSLKILNDALQEEVCNSREFTSRVNPEFEKIKSSLPIEGCRFRAEIIGWELRNSEKVLTSTEDPGMTVYGARDFLTDHSTAFTVKVHLQKS